MSPQYRKELCQRHFKCALRFYFEEFLEEKLEEFDEFWEESGEDFIDFWSELGHDKRRLLLQECCLKNTTDAVFFLVGPYWLLNCYHALFVKRDVLLKKMRDRLFSEKHVDCNLALDVLYHAAAELSKNRVKDASEILAAESPRSCINEDFGVALCEISDMLHFVETQDFPAILQQFRRDTLRLVKDTLANKKKSGEAVETEESRVARLEDIGRRMLRVFIMEVVFHENILAAFREKIARARQEELIQV